LIFGKARPTWKFEEDESIEFLIFQICGKLNRNVCQAITPLHCKMGIPSSECGVLDYRKLVICIMWHRPARLYKQQEELLCKSKYMATIPVLGKYDKQCFNHSLYKDATAEYQTLKTVCAMHRVLDRK
jgi:hypothetical protein